MSEEQRLKLENELLMTKSKAQMIDLYLDKLDQLQQKENIIKEVREYINWRLEEHQDMYKYQMEELLEILDKENK